MPHHMRDDDANDHDRLGLVKHDHDALENASIGIVHVN